MTDIKIDKIIKSRRKTFSIEIKKDGSVILRAPKSATGEDLKKIIDNKRGWIYKTQKKILDKYSKVKAKEFKNGEEFLFLGEKIKLIIDEKINSTMFISSFPATNCGERINGVPRGVPVGAQAGEQRALASAEGGSCAKPLRKSRTQVSDFIPEDGFFMPAFHEEKAKEVFLEWYKNKAFEVISERVKYYSGIFGFKYAKIRISNAEKIWGSCSAKGNINFSWRLIMAPLPIIDYVVAHELAHLAHRNHSRRFWEKVGKIIQDFKKRRKWLKENEHLFVV